MSFGQGGPSWGPGDSRTPDWAALAEASAARSRRRKWLLIGGGALATAAVAAIVATAVITTNDTGSPGSDKNASDLPAPADLPSDTSQPQPSFSSVAPPPPPDPKDYISDARKDKAPITVDAFFPGKKLTVGDRVHAKGATNRTTAARRPPRAPSARSSRRTAATRSSAPRTARTASRSPSASPSSAPRPQAKKAAQQASGGIASLSGAGVPTFCRGGAVCRRTANSYGRYAYFTVGGYTSGKNVTTADKNVYAVGDDLTEFTFRQIRHRGEVQASAAAGTTA